MLVKRFGGHGDGETILVLILGILTITRKIMGATACRVFVVGEMRRALAVLAPPGRRTAVEEAVDGAQLILASHCASCRKCRMGEG